MRVDPARLKAIAEDLTEVLASDDPSLLAEALGKLAREHGMREVAAAAGLSRGRRRHFPRYVESAQEMLGMGRMISSRSHG